MAVELIAGEKVKGESKKAVIACNDYLRLGIGRSLEKLHQSYTKAAPVAVPTKHLRVLKGWSSAYGWVERADHYDAALEAEKQAAEKERQRAIAERRKTIMEDGAALDFERVAKLKRLADFLEGQIYYEPPNGDEAARLIGVLDEMGDDDSLTDIARLVMSKLDPNDPKAKYPNVWARDVKALAGGRTVDVVRFNPAILSEFRAVIDDIAKETGGRRQRVVTENIDYSKLTDEQLQRVAAGEDPIQVILSDYSSHQS